jgi:hypothetical protein
MMTGVITGCIHDAVTGETLTTPQLSLTRHGVLGETLTRTDESGIFVYRSLPPGRYQQPQGWNRDGSLLWCPYCCCSFQFHDARHQPGNLGENPQIQHKSCGRRLFFAPTPSQGKSVFPRILTRLFSTSMEATQGEFSATGLPSPSPQVHITGS